MRNAEPSRRSLLAGAAGLWFADALAASEVSTGLPRLTMVNTVYPPFVNPVDHPLGPGLDVEIARESLKRAGFEMDLVLVPWRRVLLMLQVGEADFTTTISRRDDRDVYIDWSTPYRLGADYRFYSRRGDTAILNELEGLKGRTLGVVSGFHYPPPILESGARLFYGRDVAMLVQMLAARRIDYLVATAIAGAWEIREKKLESQLQLQPYVYTSTSPNYFGFSRKRPQAMAALPAVSLALQSLQKDGSLRRIEQRYIGRGT